MSQLHQSTKKLCTNCGSETSELPFCPTCGLQKSSAEHSKYIHTHYRIRMCVSHKKESLSPYYTVPYQSYRVCSIYKDPKTNHEWVEIELGGNKRGWMKKHVSIFNIRLGRRLFNSRDNSEDLTKPYACVIRKEEVKYPPKPRPLLQEQWNQVLKKYRYFKESLDEMPLTLINWQSRHYKLMYQWVCGDFAAKPASIIGYVRRNVQTGNEFELPETKTVDHHLGFWPHIGKAKQGYQLTIQDILTDTYHCVKIQKEVAYVPQEGDFVVIWGEMHNGICTLDQGIYRDANNRMHGAILVPQKTEMPWGFWFTDWMIDLLIILVVLLLLFFALKVAGFVLGVIISIGFILLWTSRKGNGGL